MPNKKINQLDVKVAVSTDLMLVGDPTTGTAYKSTLATLPLVPTSRTLTINGVAFDLSANRSWTISSGTVTSVGLSMPSAFSVANSPITSSGTLAVTANGTAAQYIRGDGQLATLPSGSSGGSSVAYYLNGSVAASVATYYQMSKTPIIGAGTDFSKAGNGLISQFLTDVADPNRLEIPAGNWNFEMYMSASSSGGTPAFYVELLKYNGTTFTSIASSSANLEAITGGTTIDLYVTALAIPQTTLLATDRLAIRVYIVNSTGGRTITMHTENSHLCEIITNFAGGVSALNGLTANTQYLATGTSGTDFAISSLSDTHTFNLPTASATNRGALSSADWSTFNGKASGNIYTANGTLTAARALTLGGFTLDFIGSSFTSRFTSAGRLLLGTTTESTFLLDVNGTARVSGLTQIGGGGVVSQFDGTNNNGRLFVFSATSNNGGLSFAAPEATNNDIILSVRKTGSYNMTLGTSLQTWQFTNGAKFDFGVDNVTLINNSVFQTQANFRLFGTTEDARGITFWQPGVAKRMFLYHTNVAEGGNLIIRGGGDSENSTTGTQLIKFFNSGLSVLIGSNTTMQSTSALQVDSTTKGFLPPRMTTTQRDAIASPATGLVVYNTTINDLSYHNGTAWTNLQDAITLTTTGTSGAATLVGSTLNIPQYSGGGGGGSMAIGGSITSATAGSVLFAGTSGVLQQDNANLFWDDTNNRLGIGTTSPSTALQVNGEITLRNSNNQNTLISNRFSNNVWIHNNSGTITSSAQFNVAIGMESMYNVTNATNNTAVGYQSLTSITTGADNAAIGRSSLRFVTTANNNVAVGRQSLENNTANENVAVGNYAARVNSTGTSLVAIGYQSLEQNSVSNNTAIGFQAGKANTTGANNIFIGASSAGVSVTESNRTFIGNGSTISTWLAGNLLIGSTTDNGAKAQITGKLSISAGTTGASQINLASSTAPTSPNNGDIWFDGTDLKIRIGGVTKTFVLL